MGGGKERVEGDSPGSLGLFPQENDSSRDWEGRQIGGGEEPELEAGMGWGFEKRLSEDRERLGQRTNKCPWRLSGQPRACGRHRPPGCPKRG